MRKRNHNLAHARTSAHRRAKRRAGFTLVEVMIAMTAGLVTVLATYHLGSVSSRTFNEQMRITETQGSLRAAMDQLQRDAPRAGFLSAADSSVLPVCGGLVGSTLSGSELLGGRLFGARIYPDRSKNNGAVAQILTPTGAAPGLTRADTLDLIGNFESGDVFKISSEGASDQLIFEVNRESFRRNFIVRSGVEEKFSAERFAEVFAVGRLVRVESDRRVFFRTVLSVGADPNFPSVTLASAIPDFCFKRSTALVSPISWIRYEIAPLTESSSFARLQTTSSARGAAQRVALVRSERNPADGTVRPGSERLVLDYAVEFRVDGVIPGTAPNTWQTLSDATRLGAEETQGQLRTLRIVLAARAQDVDSGVQQVPFRAAGDALNPLLGFPVDVGQGELRRARVRSLRQEIFLPNMGL